MIIEEKKIGILIFLGFGNWLWAQGLKSKFKDFAIQPSKDFRVSEDSALQKIQFSSTSTTLKTKLFIAATAVFIIASLLYQISSKSEQKIITKKTELRGNSAEIVEQPIVENKSNIPTLINSTEKQKETIHNSNVTKPLPSEKQKFTAKKDSSIENPKKVVVVKKIIQRDTVFIERTD